MRYHQAYLMARKTLAISVRHHGGYGARRHLYGRRFVGCLVQLGLLPAPDQAEPDAGSVGYDDYDREREDYGEYPVDGRVRDYLLGLADCGGSGVDLAGVVRVYGGAPLGEEADLGIGREDLVPARRERHHGVPSKGHKRHPNVLQLAHLYKDRGGNRIANQLLAAVALTVAKSWLAIPKSGKSWLMPPRGSVTPTIRKYPQAPTMTALATMLPGSHEAFRKG